MSEGNVTLEILSGSEILETKSFDDNVIEIGKLTRSDICLEDDNVSRKHARIEVESDGRVSVQDLGSTNGTRLNSMRITKAYLTDGDEIEVGITRIRVRLSHNLQKVAVAKALSSRTQITREGFYRTEEKVDAKSKLAVEVAVLWEDSPIPHLGEPRAHIHGARSFPTARRKYIQESHPHIRLPYDGASNWLEQ